MKSAQDRFRLVHLALTVLAEPLVRTALCVTRGDVRGIRVVWVAFARLYRWLLSRGREQLRKDSPEGTVYDASIDRDP